MTDIYDPGEPDAVTERPVGTRSLIYGTKALATSLVALVLSVATEGRTEPAFWVLLSAGALGVMFSFIERTTTRGAEVVSHRRVNLDVVATVVLAAFINVVIHIAQR